MRTRHSHPTERRRASSDRGSRTRRRGRLHSRHTRHSRTRASSHPGSSRCSRSIRRSFHQDRRPLSTGHAPRTPPPSPNHIPCKPRSGKLAWCPNNRRRLGTPPWCRPRLEIQRPCVDTRWPHAPELVGPFEVAVLACLTVGVRLAVSGLHRLASSSGYGKSQYQDREASQSRTSPPGAWPRDQWPTEPPALRVRGRSERRQRGPGRRRQS
jgi:hypothetical protein